MSHKHCLNITPWLMGPGDSMPHHKGSPEIPILSQINPITRIDTYLFKVHSNIVLPSPRPPQRSHYFRCPCCPWSHGGCGQKKFKTSVAVLPAPVRVPRQRSLAPSVAPVTSVANDMDDNDMIPGAIHRSPGICLMAGENPGKPQLGDCMMNGLCDRS